MANIIDVQTDDSLQYNFYSAPNGSIQFKVRAGNDAHIALTSGPNESGPMYEVFIGGWGNTKSVIRRNRTKPDKVEIDTPNILNGGEFRGFWVRWNSGVVSAGREGEAIPFISWQDPEPFPIGFVGVCTGWGATGCWKIEEMNEFITQDNLKYTFHPVPSGSLEFENPGPSTSHVCLTQGPMESDPMYENIIGGWDPFGYSTRSPAARQDSAQSAPANPTGPGTHGVWVDANSGQIPPGAVQGGQDCSGDPMFVARAQHEGALLPGKLCQSHGCAYVPWGGVENGKPEYQVLVGGPNNWIPTSGSNVPLDAFPAGETEDGEPLYVGRVRHEGSVTIGKVQKSHGVCYISFAGQELGFQEYEVLMP